MQACLPVFYAMGTKIVCAGLLILTKFQCDILDHICSGKFGLFCNYSKTCLKRPLKKKIKNSFSRLNAGQKVLQNSPREHSAILSTFIKLPFVFKTSVLSIFERPLKTGFTVWV